MSAMSNQYAPNVTVAAQMVHPRSAKRLSMFPVSSGPSVDACVTRRSSRWRRLSARDSGLSGWELTVTSANPSLEATVAASSVNDLP